jgi:hypothetical protein
LQIKSWLYIHNAGHCRRDKKNAFKIMVGKPEGKRPLERLRSRWEDNVRMYLREMGWKVWTGFIWLRIGASDGLL